MSLLPTREILAISHATASRIEAHLGRQGLTVNFSGMATGKILRFLNISVLARRFNLPDIVVFEFYRKVYWSTVSEFGQRSPLGLRLDTLLSKAAFYRVLDHMESIRAELASLEREEELVHINRGVVSSGGTLRMLIDADDPGTLLEDHRERVEAFKRRRMDACRSRPYRRNPWL